MNVNLSDLDLVYNGKLMCVGLVIGSHLGKYRQNLIKLMQNRESSHEWLGLTRTKVWFKGMWLSQTGFE